MIIKRGLPAIMRWFGLTVLRRIAGLSYFDWQDMASGFNVGGDFTLLGLSLPGLITFLIFGSLTSVLVLVVVRY